jgi:hypothetical protein
MPSLIVRRELDSNPPAQHCGGATLEDPTKALRYPASRGRGRVHDKGVTVALSGIERREPNLVHGFAHCVP